MEFGKGAAIKAEKLPDDSLGSPDFSLDLPKGIASGIGGVPPKAIEVVGPVSDIMSLPVGQAYAKIPSGKLSDRPPESAR